MDKKNLPKLQEKSPVQKVPQKNKQESSSEGEEEHPKNLIRNRNLSKNPRTKQDFKREFGELFVQKKESLKFLENKQVHWRNVISQHARNLNDGLNLEDTIENVIYIYFILTKEYYFSQRNSLMFLNKKTTILKINFSRILRNQSL